MALENIYNEEKNSIVKTAPKLLNSKALYPTSIEKQNVQKYLIKLILFHENFFPNNLTMFTV